MTTSSEKCRSCAAPIRWVRTAATDALMPLDHEPNPDGNVELDAQGRAVVHPAGQASMFEQRPTRYMPHHATCPQGREWRR